MTHTELQEFWSMRKVKIWVVNLYAIGRNKETDVKIVRAKTKENALICAQNNSIYFSKKKCSGEARLADPEIDLKCIKTPVERKNRCILNLNETGMVFYMKSQRIREAPLFTGNKADISLNINNSRR